MIAASRSVTFIDILIMHSIQEAEQSGYVPSKYRIIKFYNEFIETHGIEIDRASKIKNSYSFQQHMDKLRKFTLITPENEYRLTDNGKQLVEKVGSNWRIWPLYIPFDGSFRYDQAFYLN